MELETVNKLYLELSQFATAKTKNDLELEKILAAIEAMRVAGGRAEFQAAFDKAKKLAMAHNVVGKFTMKIQEEE